MSEGISACRGCGQAWFHAPACPVEQLRRLEPGHAGIVHRVRDEDCTPAAACETTLREIAILAEWFTRGSSS